SGLNEPSSPRRPGCPIRSSTTPTAAIEIETLMKAAPRSPTCLARAALAGGWSATSPPTASVHRIATARLITALTSSPGTRSLPDPYHATSVAIGSLPSNQAEHVTLTEVVQALARLDRRAGCCGGEEAARWLASRLARAGCETRVDEEQFLDGYARPIGLLAAGSALSGAAGLSRRLRRLAALGGAAVTAAIADDISNGPR